MRMRGSGPSSLSLSSYPDVRCVRILRIQSVLHLNTLTKSTVAERFSFQISHNDNSTSMVLYP